MSDTEPIYRPGRMIAGRYRITTPLSQGGMGAVYLAQQVSLGRDVALKVMLERGADPELVKRFDVEARAVCQLKHPNIITYHDYGRDDDGHPFLVMEYLAGYPGTKLVYGERRPGLLDLVHVVAQVCSALHEAHIKNIIHRDLKWSNVMICPQSHDPYFAKLIDFGIMKVATDGSSGDQRALTRTGMLLGTPEYMSPEAICGMPIDGRADQYSLAIMMWEALEGHRPFDAASHFELLRQQVQDQAPPFEVAAGLVTIYPQIEAVLAQAMEKHPSDRFDDILAFQQALMAAVGLVTAATTAPARPAARRSSGTAGTRNLRAEKPLANGMPPPSRPRLPATPDETPRPVDTAHKTGRQPAEKAPARPHWAWLVAAFVVFVGVGFGVVAAILASTRSTPAPTQVAAMEKPDAADAAIDAAAETTAAPTQVAAADTVAMDTSRPDTVAPETVATIATAAETSIATAPETLVADAGPVDGIASASVTPAADAVASDVAEAPKAADATAVVAAEVAEPDKGKPAGTGFLYVQVDPWGNVALDGRPVGRAPYEAEVKAGPHSITITNTYFKGAYRFGVKVEGGKRTARTIVLEQYLERIE